MTARLQPTITFRRYGAVQRLVTEGIMGRREGDNTDSNTSGDGANAGNAGGGNGRHGSDSTNGNSGDGARQ
ncbi:hypothetical protein Airi02_002250 [Actinoallomurus iriomotensis]|uniref:Uncharacterized protein n=1 Tax=Actinoallomurus iriomotensis TaxID=478107 RepID=A0A9W6RV61_9ACTN|nr:hypothetical protein Airi02_002250 [Actinoallomurus iriomotensis]